MDTTMPMRVRFISCNNDTGAHLAARLLWRLGGARFAAVADGDTSPPDVAVIVCPPDCDT